jgi:tRNA A-37 threonylcarbamoyl transferase component Bud32
MFTSVAQDKEKLAERAGQLAQISDPSPAWRDGCAAHASPSWRGVDAAGIFLDGARPVFAKAYHGEISLYGHWPSIATAARHAGEIGVGPRIIAVDIEHGLLVMEALGDGWRAATLADMAPGGKYGTAVLKLRKALHAGPKLPRTLTVGDHIEELHEALARAEAYCPGDFPELIGNARKIAVAIRAAGHDLVPAHGDGNASNVMIHENQMPRLVDYDLAANRDPYEDLASHLVEAFWFTADMAAVFEEFHGRADEELFARVRLYGVADDLRWAMIGLLTSHLSPRRSVEYLKFAEWRLLRARMAMRHPDFETCLGRL